MSNINYVKRIIVTTNGVVYKFPEPEVSNRVLRSYSKYVDYFIRIKLIYLY